MKTLGTLLQAIPEVKDSGHPELEIHSLTADSRQVVPGSMFVAVIGTETDGHRYIEDAVNRGAVAVVGQRDLPGSSVPYFQVPNSRLAYALLASAWYGYPSRQMVMVGVTGTDGKTTTANMLYQGLLEAGLKVGLVTTVNARIGEREYDTGFHVTTPDALSLQRYLREMVDQGSSHCVVEATSHGLAQHRVSGTAFDVGVLTNITHEHLDYHGSFEAYLDAKSMLFESLHLHPSKPKHVTKAAVLNRDDPSFLTISSRTEVEVISYGWESGADWRLEAVGHHTEGIQFTVIRPDRRVKVISPLLGEYNAHNALAAIAAGVSALGLTIEQAIRGAEAVRSIPGRMEAIDLGQEFIAIVDFAHTPGALEQALATARQLSGGRVLAVFGSAGLRDREKRNLMARASQRLADISVLTAEDPRTESLEGILAEMAEGALAEGGVEGVTFWRIPDRGQAIRFAVAQADPEDVVILCGKGHEQSMCFGETEYPWDDRVALRAALSELLGVEGPQMPELPTRKSC